MIVFETIEDFETVHQFAAGVAQMFRKLKIKCFDYEVVSRESLQIENLLALIQEADYD